jgi:hypothetical protein
VSWISSVCTAGERTRRYGRGEAARSYAEHAAELSETWEEKTAAAPPGKRASSRRWFGGTVPIKKIPSAALSPTLFISFRRWFEKRNPDRTRQSGEALVYSSFGDYYSRRLSGAVMEELHKLYKKAVRGTLVLLRPELRPGDIFV